MASERLLSPTDTPREPEPDRFLVAALIVFLVAFSVLVVAGVALLEGLG